MRMNRDEITPKMSGKLNRAGGVASGLAAGILGKKTEAGVRADSAEVRSFAELDELHGEDPGFFESLFYLAISPVVLPLVVGHWIYENVVRTKIRNPAFAELGGAKLEDVLYSADGAPIPLGNGDWLLPSNYSYFGRESEVCDKETFPKRPTDESSADEETTTKANALVDRATKSLGSVTDLNILPDNG
mgnify:CR=1 FL=1